MGDEDSVSFTLGSTHQKMRCVPVVASLVLTHCHVFCQTPVPPASPEPIQLTPASPAREPDDALSMANSEECYFCRQRVYVLERISAEGKFFHRSCFTCHQCAITLRLGGYTFDQSTGERSHTLLLNRFPPSSLSKCFQQQSHLWYDVFSHSFPPTTSLFVCIINYLCRHPF